MRDSTFRSTQVTPDEPVLLTRAAFDTPALVIVHLQDSILGSLGLAHEAENLRNVAPLPPPDAYILPPVGFEGFMLAPGQSLYGLPQTPGSTLSVSIARMDYPTGRLPPGDQRGRIRFIGPLSPVDGTQWMVKARDNCPARVNMRVVTGGFAFCDDFGILDTNPNNGFVLGTNVSFFGRLPLLLAPRQSLYIRPFEQNDSQLGLQIRDALDEDWILDVD